MLELVHEAGTHVMFENQEIVAHNALVNPALRRKVTASWVMNSMQQLISGASTVSPEQDADKVKERKISKYLFPQYNNIYVTVRAYYHGWVFSKLSPWKESMDEHILLVSQVGVIFIISLLIAIHLASSTPQSGILMKPKQKLFASMDKAAGKSPRDNLEVIMNVDDRDNCNDDDDNHLEVMDLGFFILPNLLLVGGLGCALLAFLWELSDGTRKY